MVFARCMGRSKKKKGEVRKSAEKRPSRSLSRLSSFERLGSDEERAADKAANRQVSEMSQNAHLSMHSTDSFMPLSSANTTSFSSRNGDSTSPAAKPRGKTSKTAKPEVRRRASLGALGTLAENRPALMCDWADPPPDAPTPRVLKAQTSNMSRTSNTSSASRFTGLPSGLKPLGKGKRSSSVPNIKRKGSAGVITDTTHRWVYEAKAISLSDFLNELPSDYGAKKNNSRQMTPGSLHGVSSIETIEPTPPPPLSPTTIRPPPTPSERPDEESEIAVMPPALLIDLDSVDAVIRNKEANAVYSDFSKLLLSPVGLAGFGKFLTETHCCENLDFYLAVTNALQSEDPIGFTPRTGRDSGSGGKSSLQGIASPHMAATGVAPSLAPLEEIHDQFVMEGAPMMVNLKGERRKAIQQELLKIGGANKENVATRLMLPSFASDALVAAFTAAQQEVFQLMKTDNFPRFLASPHAEEWKGQCLVAVDEVSKIEKERMKREAALESR